MLAEYVKLPKMKTIDVTKGTSLKDWVTLANQESEVVLTQDNQPVAKVLPIASPPKAPDGISSRRTLGLHRGACTRIRSTVCRSPKLSRKD
jgi:antitoxin (DNA-binding transcriptional repressor) of toxin-antitoxin stability system